MQGELPCAPAPSAPSVAPLGFPGELMSGIFKLYVLRYKFWPITQILPKYWIVDIKV